VKVISTDIRERPNGEFELFVELDVDEDDWERGGDLRGFSFTLTGTLVPANPTLKLFADADHYDSEVIRRAASQLTEAFNVEAGVLYQFSYLPPPLILVHVPWGVLADIGTSRRRCAAAGRTGTLRGPHARARACSRVPAHMYVRGSERVPINDQRPIACA
jgi:hypothetical protein